MGFYVRKSVRVGPFRFNLSKSGVGVSAGVKGFRVGTGPRGNYVHMGLGGLYYRAAMPSAAAPAAPEIEEISGTGTSTHAPLAAIGSADVSEMVDSSAGDLLTELNDKHQRSQSWLWIGAGSALLTLTIALMGGPPWLVVVVGGILAALTVLSYQFDLARKSVVVMYDFEPAMEAGYQRLHECIESMSRCQGRWHLHARGQVYDRKYHAGASHVIDRKAAQVGNREPPYVRTNIAVPSMMLRGISLYFFPERLLVYRGNEVGAVPYRDLAIEGNDTQMIEDGRQPSEAQVVGQTWQYTNKGGGPDRRFKNNRELPICLYEEICLRSSTGLNEILQLTRRGLAAELGRAVRNMAMLIEQASAAPEQAAAPRITRLPPPAPPPLPTVHPADLFEALLEILGCIMVADGRASRSEKERIGELMKSLRAPWSDDEIDRRITAFIEKVQSAGYRQVRSAALASVDVFRQRGQQALLLSCLDRVAKADQTVDEREAQLIERIRNLTRAGE